jgi:hypothetical protein
MEKSAITKVGVEGPNDQPDASSHTFSGKAPISVLS